MRWISGLILFLLAVLPTPLIGDKHTHEQPPVRVMIFMRTDCAEGRRYAPEIQRLQARYFNQGVEFMMTFPDPADTEDRIEKYFKSLGYVNNVYLRQGALQAAQDAQATVAPEAAVYDHEVLIYRGRIGDAPAAKEKKNKQEGVHNLDDAIRAALDHRRPSVAETQASGCPLF